MEAFLKQVRSTQELKNRFDLGHYDWREIKMLSGHTDHLKDGLLVLTPSSNSFQAKRGLSLLDNKW